MYYRSFLAASYPAFWQKYNMLAAHARHCYEASSTSYEALRIYAYNHLHAPPSPPPFLLRLCYPDPRATIPFLGVPIFTLRPQSPHYGDVPDLPASNVFHRPSR